MARTPKRRKQMRTFNVVAETENPSMVVHAVNITTLLAELVPIAFTAEDAARRIPSLKSELSKMGGYAPSIISQMTFKVVEANDPL
jgi:hypothetical protein